MLYAFLSLILFSSSVYSKFAYVNYEKLIQSSEIYIKMNNDLTQLRFKHKSEIEAMDNDLASKHKELMEIQDISVRESKAQEYQAGVEKSRLRKQELRSEYDDIKQARMKSIMDQVKSVSKKLNDSRGYDAILRMDAIYVNGNVVDVTDELIGQMNKGDIS